MDKNEKLAKKTVQQLENIIKSGSLLAAAAAKELERRNNSK